MKLGQVVTLMTLTAAVAIEPSGVGQQHRRAARRERHQRKGKGGPSPDDHVQLLEQPLDHYDRSPKAAANTWQQRYWVNTTFYDANPDQANAPVFLCVGGESDPMHDDILITGEEHCALMLTAAAEHGALVAAVEHRFYNPKVSQASPPTPRPLPQTPKWIHAWIARGEAAIDPPIPYRPPPHTPRPTPAPPGRLPRGRPLGRQPSLSVVDSGAGRPGGVPPPPFDCDGPHRLEPLGHVGWERESRYATRLSTPPPISHLPSPTSHLPSPTSHLTTLPPPPPSYPSTLASWQPGRGTSTRTCSTLP